MTECAPRPRDSPYRGMRGASKFYNTFAFEARRWRTLLEPCRTAIKTPPLIPFCSPPELLYNSLNPSPVRESAMTASEEAQFRVGLLVPSSNATMERDFHRNLPEEVHVATSRMFLDETTKQAEIRMLEESLPEANRMLKTVAPHFCVFGCTSGGALFGQSHDKKIQAQIEEETGAETATILSALAREFDDMNAKKLVVLTPYVDELNAPIRASLEEDGLEVLSIDGMGITDNIEIGNTRADKILKFADEKLSTQNLKKADCLFISCTNLPAVDALPEIQTRYPGLPVMTSNLAALMAVRRKLDGE